MPMAKGTRLCNCWARRWRWQSRVASSASLSTKAHRWLNYCPKRLLVGLCRTISASYWLHLNLRQQTSEDKPSLPLSQPLIEPLSQRELEVLHLVAQGLSNREISERLFLTLSTVKGHNRQLFGKLQVQSRTEAVARARELGLL